MAVHATSGALAGPATGYLCAGTDVLAAGSDRLSTTVGGSLLSAEARRFASHQADGALQTFSSPPVLQASAQRTINSTKTSSEQDDFEDGVIGAGWETFVIGGATGTITESGGKLRLTMTSGTIGHGLLIRRAATKDFADSYVYARLSSALVVSNNSAGGEFLFGVLSDADSGYGWHQQSNGTIQPVWRVAGVSDASVTQAYTPSTHAWLRIKEQGGNVLWQRAPATASDPPNENEWVTAHTRARSADGSFAISAVRMRLMINYWGGSPGLPLGPVQVDCVNTRTTNLVAHAATGALAGPGHSLAGTAAKKVTHATTGALTQAASLLAAAMRGFEHTASGAIAGSSAIMLANGSTSDVTRKLWIDTQDTAGAWSDKPQTADPWTDVPHESGSWGS